jgi:hypothetical protein
MISKCSANLQVGIFESHGCPPEGGRYINQIQVSNVASEYSCPNCADKDRWKDLSNKRLWLLFF